MYLWVRVIDFSSTRSRGISRSGFIVYTKNENDNPMSIYGPLVSANYFFLIPIRSYAKTMSRYDSRLGFPFDPKVLNCEEQPKTQSR